MSTQNQIRDVLNRHYDYPSQKLAFKACLDDLTNLFKEERRAALKDVRELIATVNPKLIFGSANGSVMKQAILGTVDTRIGIEAALEAAANETKGEANDG